MEHWPTSRRAAGRAGSRPPRARAASIAAWRRQGVARVLAAVLAGLWVGASAAGPASDALASQQRAIAAIDALGEATFRSPTLAVDKAALAAPEAELDRSNRVLEAAGDWPHVVPGLIRQAKTRGLIAGRDDQFALLQRAVQAAEKSGDATLQALALAERSRIELEQAALGPALADARRAVHLTDGQAAGSARVKALSAYGDAQLKQGEPIAAAETAQAEVAATAGATDPMARYWALGDRADAYLAVAELCRTQPTYDDCRRAVDVAEADLREASAFAGQHGYPALAAMVGTNLQRAGVMRVQIDGMQRLTQLSAAGWHNARSASDVMVAPRVVPSGAQKDNPAMAQLRAHLQASEATRQAAPRYDDADHFEARGVVEQWDGHHEQATEWYLRAVDALERDRRTIGDERARSRFLGARLEIYKLATLELLQQQRFDEAFDVIERSRSRVLADMLASRPPTFADARSRALFADMLKLREQIAAEQAVAFSDDGQDAARSAAEGALKEHQLAYEQLTARMAAETPSLASLRSSRGADLASLRQAMRAEDFELLQYMFTPTGLLIWHTSAAGSDVRTVLVLRNHVTETMAKLADSLRHPQQPFDEASARELYYLMVGPVKANLGSRHLVILPFEGEVAFPFEALVDPADGRFLGESFQVTYAPSATVLMGLHRGRPLSQARALALGDPALPGASAEIGALRQVFGGRGVFRADRRPREADVRSAVAGADVVHLAVHGSFDGSDPMASYLVLDPDKDDDGHLTAAEMFALRLDRGPLVVLSGCETGLSVTTAQGESLGMSRGLLYSGAGALLLSQWRVDSAATAAWMQAFYRAAATLPLAAAAQRAADAVRSDPATRHPYYWAPFLLTAR